MLIKKFHAIVAESGRKINEARRIMGKIGDHLQKARTAAGK